MADDDSFKAHAPGITVEKPSKMVQEQWFLDAIRDRPDFFLFGERYH